MAKQVKEAEWFIKNIQMKKIIQFLKSLWIKFKNWEEYK